MPTQRGAQAQRAAERAKWAPRRPEDQRTAPASCDKGSEWLPWTHRGNYHTAPPFSLTAQSDLATTRPTLSCLDRTR